MEKTKYVTEMSEETHIEDIGESKRRTVAKARPKQTPSSMLSSATILVPYHDRKWIDVEPGRCDKSCLEVSKLMIRLMRHDDAAPREDDGAVKCQDLASIFALVNSNMAKFLAKRRWNQKKIPMLLGFQFT